MRPPKDTIANALQQLTLQMQRDGLWQDEMPAPEKLASKLPFCVDTLTFTQWLQWVMFPKLFALLEAGATLPANSNMATMAEQAFKQYPQDTDTLLGCVTALDSAINQQPQ
ncbi:MAG: YqcC family protein [Pseudomonadales bacterium]